MAAVWCCLFTRIFHICPTWNWKTTRSQFGLKCLQTKLLIIWQVGTGNLVVLVKTFNCSEISLTISGIYESRLGSKFLKEKKKFLVITRWFLVYSRKHLVISKSFLVITRSSSLLRDGFSFIRESTSLFRKVSRYYEMVSRLFEKVPRYFEKVFRYYEKFPRYYEMASRLFEKVTMHARVLKFHVWIPHGKKFDTRCFLVRVTSLSGVMPLWKKIRTKSDACHILWTVHASVLKFIYGFIMEK